MHLLGAGGEERHAAIIHWLVSVTPTQTVLELLERGDKLHGLPLPVQMAKKGTRAHHALIQAAQEARRRMEVEYGEEDVSASLDDSAPDPKAKAKASSAEALRAAEAALLRLAP